MFRRLILLLLALLSLLAINACDSEPPTLMKATTQFESNEKRDKHIAYMRKNHIDALKHKRDETMYKGIRTEKNSINACINCHVPLTHNGKVLRHTDQEHFCTTCHTYVAAKLDCFECHVDHPIKTQIYKTNSNLSNTTTSNTVTTNHIKTITSLTRSEQIDLAFTHSKPSDKANYIENKRLSAKGSKSGGVSLLINNKVKDIKVITNNLITNKLIPNANNDAVIIEEAINE